ncbi:Leucine Rich Repeat [Seminavis robusta]|uniref:Leucine Rich Repeat n=1 Tax=Seminavis robusta TaxID=568900 RepID=A0A9N8HHN0_9STRA|nr:Leucine Rich Repeat [Seminavis robusta]|eukprot:Sro572_g168730.1 Leucine Rich Repeat (485) ;mRNA; r:9808-11262
MQLHGRLEQVMPSELSNLSNLTSLVFNNNSLTGEIPPHVGSLRHLTLLNLSHNQLQGALPTEIALLTNLETLSLESNAFRQPVPKFLANLTSLVNLSIKDNPIAEQLPPTICTMPSLRFLQADCDICPPECSYRDLCRTCDLPTTQPSIVPTSVPSAPPSQPVNVPSGEVDVEHDDGDSIETLPSTPLLATVAPTLLPYMEFGMTQYPTSEPDEFVLSLPEYTIAALNFDNSPQSLAYRWLEDHPELISMTDWKKAQLFGLATFLYSFPREEWFHSGYEAWDNYTVVNECEADGALGSTHTIHCDLDGRITELSAHSIQGINVSVLPKELGMLSSLEAVSISFMGDLSIELESAIPLQQLLYVPLKTLSIHDTGVFSSIPTTLAMMRGLTSLELQTNALTNEIPSELGLLSRLETLNLFGNLHLGGAVPSELGMVTLLKSLLLDRTAVGGFIPEEVCALSSLSLRVNCSLITNCAECAPCFCYI